MNRYILNSEQDELSKRGAIGTILVHLLLLLVLWFFTIKAVPPTVKGLIVNFGTVETGQGEESPQAQEEQTTPPPPVESDSKPTENVAPPKVEEKKTPAPAIEQEVHEVKDDLAPSLPTEKVKKKKDTKDKKKDKKKPEPPKPQEKVEEPPKLDARAIFTKRNNSSSNSNNKSSQGNNDPMADQGTTTDENYRNQNSDIYQPTRDIGMSDSGNFRVDLVGRNLIRKPAVDKNFSKEGIIAVKIRVDNNGKVVGAEYTPKGSTTGDSKLKNIALKAAYDAKFNFDPNAPAMQTGTIFFTFKIR